ncbi:hypothetical protein ZIOFF_071535 [Zingiber officinale]|uniref:GATA-type domain-containing protein n=1 Tax=Zingiber officinale TaxID=94328 RepID=A0A8J5EBI0_ZINOF|nr:hypothetical protein ZIOFF_071535 [Zingiber officinale]
MVPCRFFLHCVRRRWSCHVQFHACVGFVPRFAERFLNGVAGFWFDIVFVIWRCVDSEEMEDGVGDLFDRIEDLLDFPGDEDVLGMVEPRGDHSGWHSNSSPGSFADQLLGRSDDGKDSLEGVAGENKKSVDEKFSTEEEKQSPYDELDIVQLEWMSEFLEDSDSFSLAVPCSGGAVNKSTNSGDGHGQAKVNELCSFFTSSPVLQANTNAGGSGGGSYSSSSFSFSSSSSTSGSYFTSSNKDTRSSSLPLSPTEPLATLVVPGRARSKRTRRAAFSPRGHVVVPYYSPSPFAVAVPDPVSTSGATSDPESFGESFSASPPLRKKQNKKSTVPVGDETDSPQPVRKCTHCEIQKTPQWRAGPLGPKTLCNACGVRYKSGRLFPEYRPAASPTFVPSIHSNSHKKVVEMRIEATQRAASDGCDLLTCIRRRE